MSVVILLVVSAIALLYFWIHRNYNYWLNRGFLSAPTIFPFGSIKGVAREFTSAECLNGIYQKFKGKAQAAGFFFFVSPVMMPMDPELIKNLLVRDFSSFHDRGFYYNKKDDPLSANLLSLEGAEWRERRVKLTPIFTSGKMKMMFEIVNSIGEKCVSAIDRELKISSDLEVKELLSKFTTDVIGNVAFGIECNCLEDPNTEFRRLGQKIFNRSPFEFLRFFVSLAFPNISRKLGIPFLPVEPANFFLDTFLQTLKYRESHKEVKRNDFVQLLSELKKSGSYTDTELAAEGFLVYAAGFETSSTLLTFCCYELALNQEIQEQLRDELKSRIEENDGQLTYELLFDLKYLDMVVNETLRKYPPIPQLLRKSTAAYKIPGTELMIEKGTTIQFPIYSLHHDAEYYPDPETFDPQRFTPENVKARQPFTFLPFGEGPRKFYSRIHRK